jgi:probable rRNA maturation factor
MNIVIANRQRTRHINARHLRLITVSLFEELQIHEGELGINLVGAREMTLVNETFLKHAGSTDVITFDHVDGSPKNGSPALHGELFICVDEAILQARRFRTRWQSEVVRYVVHGVLHLLGHDDLRTDRRRKMKREENRLVRRLSRKFSLAQTSSRSKLVA